MNSRSRVPTINIFLMIAGAWLMITSFVFEHHIGTVKYGYFIGSPAQANELWTGFLVFVVALICAVRPSVSSWLSWVNVALGIWLVLSPFLLGYADVGIALWNEVIVGLIIVGLGVWSARESRGAPAAHR